MTLHPTVGIIREDSPRAQDWRRVFGDTTVPLRSPAAIIDEEGRSFYMVDVERLTPMQVSDVVAHVADRFGLPPEQVRADIVGEHGIPILADDVSVSFDARLLL